MFVVGTDSAMKQSLGMAMLLTLIVSTATACPSVLWASQPVRPNETVIAQGCGLSQIRTVNIRVNDSCSVDVDVTESSPNGLHFVVPPELPFPAIYELRLPTSAASFKLNMPEVDGFVLSPCGQPSGVVTVLLSV